jgi:recombination protein RecA
MYGTGISREGTILDLASSMEIIEKSGTWYSYKGERLGQGKENVKAFLKDHPEISNEIEKIIRDTLAAEPEKFEEVMVEAPQTEELTPELPEA